MTENTTNQPEEKKEVQQQPQQATVIQESVPNATGALVLGIISIATCWCYGIIGITLGIIALVLAGKGNTLYMENPEKYTESSYKNLKAGKICAIIGLSLSALWIVYIIVIMLFYGAALTAMPWDSL